MREDVGGSCDSQGVDVTMTVITAWSPISWGMVEDTAPTAVVGACEPHKSCDVQGFVGEIDAAGYRHIDCRVHGTVWTRSGL